MSNTSVVPFVELQEFEKRIIEFLPGGADVPHDVRIAMAQISIAHGLDPWLREVWPIPIKNKNREIIGWELMVGISGWRSSAHRTNEYWGRRFEKVSDEDRKALGAAPNDIVTRCIIMRRRTGQSPAEYDGYGVASPTEFSKMNKFQLARLRAERDAMKAAFPISFPAGVNVTVGDDDGETINGEHEWQLTGSRIEAHDIDISANRHALGRDDGDLTGASTTQPQPDTLDELTQATGREAVTNAPAPEVSAVVSGAIDWAAKYKALNLIPAKYEAALQHCGGDFETAYYFVTKSK